MNQKRYKPKAVDVRDEVLETNSLLNEGSLSLHHVGMGKLAKPLLMAERECKTMKVVRG